ncbi:uncharacterized protein SAPINGB_P001141 [Magnusiomyces paraingens]|uniref:Uncharacterized protein n=1 Tax=Magnusiomyces paraingens TaxID=2606893 RepID=A0A5E8BAH6_9ASCO|nr:uncharacterized protein SAPINGB_P001141 [Saprochaete ingens]VVT46292.1 unnamed protein product [Saprochaete ingens]
MTCQTSLLDFPREVHLALISFLAATDCAALGQTHPILRQPYSQASFRHCSLSLAKTLFNPSERPIPLSVFFAPSRHSSWFPSHSVLSANLLFRKAGAETDALLAALSHESFTKSYPNLRKIKWRIFIGKSDRFAQSLTPILLPKSPQSSPYSSNLIIHSPSVLASLAENNYAQTISSLEFNLLTPLSATDMAAFQTTHIPQTFPNINTLIFKCPHTLVTESTYITLVTNISNFLPHLKALTLTNGYFSRAFFEALATLPQDIPFFKLSFRNYDTVADDALLLLDGAGAQGLDHPVGSLIFFDLQLPQITHLCENSGPYFLRYPILLQSLAFPRLRSMHMLESDISCFSLLINNPKVPIFAHVSFIDIQVNNYDTSCLLVSVLQCCPHLERLRLLRAISPSHFAFANVFENTSFNAGKISPPQSKTTISEILTFIRLNFLEDILDLDQSKYNNYAAMTPASKSAYYQKKAHLEAKIKNSIPPQMLRFERLFMLLSFILDPFGTRYSASLEDILVYWIQLCSCGYWERLGSALTACPKLRYVELGYSDSAFRRERELVAVTRSDIRPLDCPRFHHFVATHPSLRQLVLVNCATHHVHSISQEHEANAYSFGKYMKKGSRWANNQVDLITVVDTEAARKKYEPRLQADERLDCYIVPDKWKEYKASKGHTPEIFSEGLDSDDAFLGWK